MSCDKLSTSKYSLPSASVTEMISEILFDCNSISLNLSKLPQVYVSLLKNPDTTLPYALTAKKVGAPVAASTLATTT